MRILWFYCIPILIAVAVLFIMRALSYFALAQKGLEKHDKATDIKTKDEIWEKHCEAQMNALCWTGAAILALLAMGDCILNIIQGVDFL